MTSYELESSRPGAAIPVTYIPWQLTSSVMWAFHTFQIHAHTGEEVQPRLAGFEDPPVPFDPMCPTPSCVPLFFIYQAEAVPFCA